MRSKLWYTTEDCVSWLRRGTTKLVMDSRNIESFLWTVARALCEHVTTACPPKLASVIEIVSDQRQDKIFATVEYSGFSILPIIFPFSISNKSAALSLSLYIPSSLPFCCIPSVLKMMLLFFQRRSLTEVESTFFAFAYCQTRVIGAESPWFVPLCDPYDDALNYFIRPIL